MKEFLKKNWLVILIGCLSAFLGVLTLLTVVKLRRTTPVTPTAPESKPKAVVPACTLTFQLAFALTPTPTEDLSPTPVETLSPTPTLSEIPTSTPTLIPTSKPNDIPICAGLSANPTSGEEPLEVAFTGNGSDRDGKITAFDFSFGDGETKMVEKDVEGTASHSLDYTYFLPGTYWASLRVRDNNDVWSETPESCKVKIEVEEKGVGGMEPSPTPKEIAGIAQVLSATPTPEEIPEDLTTTPTSIPISETPPVTSTPIPVPEVPEAGIALPTILTILSGSLLILLGILL